MIGSNCTERGRECNAGAGSCGQCTHVPTARHILSLVLVLLAACVLVSCGGDKPAPTLAESRPPDETRGPLRFELIESRVDAVPGKTLLIPVRVIGRYDPTRPPDVRLEDGRRLDASVHWVGVEPEASSGPLPWLPPAGRWTVASPDGGVPDVSLGAFMLAIEMPRDGVGLPLWIGPRRVVLNWLPSPEILATRTEPSIWTPPVGASVRTSAGLSQLLEPERRSPVRRWRARLVEEGLRPDIAPERRPDRFQNPILEAYAQQYEAQWQAAFAALAAADADVCKRLRAAIAKAVTGPSGPPYPAWPVSQADLDRLLSDLNAPSTSARERARHAMSFIEAQPTSVAWVFDDAGATSEHGLPTPRIGVANLADEPALTFARVGREKPGTPVALAPDTSDIITCTAPTIGATVVDVRIGEDRSRQQVVGSPVPVTPPGLRIGPLLTDWTLLEWSGAGVGAPPLEAWATSAMLYRGTLPSQSAEQWLLLIECNAPDASVTGQWPEQVRVWLGPSASPTAAIGVNRDGSAFNLLTPSAERVGGVHVERSRNRWTVIVPVPRGAIEPSGVLRIGIERHDSRGWRTAWPRRMLPWQTAPGRAAASLNEWAGVGG